MQQAKIDICFAFTHYAGNGGIASTIPHLRRWWATEFHKLCQDERIGRIGDLSDTAVSDTPITMVRNKCLREAQRGGFDVLVFIDSDNCPDLYVGADPEAKPFLESSIDFVYRRLLAGVPTIIAAPYCGPPPHPVNGGEENCYVFKWQNTSTGDEWEGASVVAYSRDEAALMSGIHPAAALPTGLCMITLNCLECLPPPYFRYEWKDHWEDQKASTEDVYFTRNMAMGIARQHGTPGVFCNWDAWAGHYKQKMVGKPTPLRIEDVTATFTKAVRQDIGQADRIRYIGFKKDGTIEVPPSLQRAVEVAPEGDSLHLRQRGIPCKPREFLLNGHPFTAIGFQTPRHDAAALVEAIRAKYGEEPITGVEVGSWVGYTASEMLDNIPGLSLLCVDTFDGTDSDICGEIAKQAARETGDPRIIENTFRKNMARFGERVAAIKGRSNDAAQTIDDGSLDFVFIDAGHEYMEVKSDIKAWLPKVKPGGLVLGHDYHEVEYPGVYRVAHEAFGEAVQSNARVWWAEVPPQESLIGPHEEPFEEDHRIVPAPVGDRVAECDETLNTAEDRASLARVLDDTFGRTGRDNRKFVYIGTPDPGVLSFLDTRGNTFCITEHGNSRLEYALEALNKASATVRFVRYGDEVQDAPYWRDGDTELVYINKTAPPELARLAMKLLRPGGIICGNGESPLEMQAGEVGSLWGITRSEYEEALASNGKEGG